MTNPIGIRNRLYNLKFRVVIHYISRASKFTASVIHKLFISVHLGTYYARRFLNSVIVLQPMVVISATCRMFFSISNTFWNGTEINYVETILYHRLTYHLSANSSNQWHMPNQLNKETQLIRQVIIANKSARSAELKTRLQILNALETKRNTSKSNRISKISFNVGSAKFNWI